jgi:hypothetical protein
MIRSKMLTVMITLFFIGIIISGGCLYLLMDKSPGDIALQTCILVGATFVTGIIAIALARWTKEYVVVYREKSNEDQVEKIEENRVSSGLLDLEVLQNKLGQLEHPQKWINEMCAQLGAGQAAVYRVGQEEIELKFGYALAGEKISGVKYNPGEGLIGRVASEGIPLYVNPVPQGYITVFSGLGSSSPSYLTIVPVKDNNEVVGVLEVATFANLDTTTRQQMEKASEQIGAFLTTK